MAARVHIAGEGEDRRRHCGAGNIKLESLPPMPPTASQLKEMKEVRG